jgi:hypothetical protein
MGEEPSTASRALEETIGLPTLRAGPFINLVVVQELLDLWIGASGEQVPEDNV